MWELRYERDGFSVEAAKKKGRRLPDDHWFNDKPPMPFGADFFFAAYRDLVSCRPPDGPIPWTAAMKWARHHDLDRGLSDALWTVVNRLDNADRQWRFDESKGNRGGA